MGHVSAEEHKKQVAGVWKVTALLAIVTVVEVGIALFFDNFLKDILNRWFLNIFMIVMSIFKAFYIVNIFMHLKWEKRLMNLTILVPLLFFIWFIIAFLMEGQAYHESHDWLPHATM